MADNTIFASSTKDEVLHLHREIVEQRVRRVSFADRTIIYLVPALSDMSSKEVDAAFASDDDLKEIQADVVATVKAMRRGTKDASMCMRGLEHMRSAEHLEQRRINKECVIQAVLDEQDRQWSAGKEDHEEIADIAAHGSRWARDYALAFGESDASSARRIYNAAVKKHN